MLKISKLSFWNSIPFLTLLLFIAPVLIVLSSIFTGFSDNINHIFSVLLIEYVSNSLVLVFGVSILVFLIGVTTAWLVTNYNFFGKKILEWALILPLAIPPYILAYTFTGLFDSFGTLNNFAREIFFLDETAVLFPNVRNIYGGIIIFGFTLYPYLYLLARMSFFNQSQSMIEAGRMLGLNKFQVFQKISLPLMRPAIIGGLIIVAMEVLSDFGAVEHFAIPTFTTGIFKAWNGMYDITAAMQLASLLLIFLIVLIVLERTSRRDSIFSPQSSNFKPVKEKKLKGMKNLMAFAICFLPIFIGFLLPVGELSVWALNHNSVFFTDKFLQDALNTLAVSLIAAVLCTALALVINFAVRLNKNNLLKTLSSFLTIGYGMPGLILAIGILQLTTFIDKSFNIFLTGSLFGLIMAYLIKSYALPNLSIEAGFTRIDQKLDDSAKTLKSTGWDMLFNVHFPLLKGSLFTGLLLVFAEIVKELPATLVLQPFNFDTLAVSTYKYAVEERMFEAAAPAISIVLIGLIPIIFLSQMIRRSRPVK